jgi:UDP-GlcNAc:undecaprenyl-phosphate GlcNAc-1-phosphate transferase
LRRRVNPLTTAGKDHTSHRLVRLGYSQREAVLLLYLLGGVFGMIGLFVTQATVVEGYVIGGMVAVLALFAIYWLDENVNPFRPKIKQ